MVLSTSLSFLLLSALAFFSLSARALPHSRTTPRAATLKLAVRINSYGVKSIADADRARAKFLQEDRSGLSISAANAGIIYTADIGVGTPPTNYTLLVDTGSSNTWIGAHRAYVKTSTSDDTGDTFDISYGTTSETKASGEEYLDTVTLNSDLVIDRQSIGVSSSQYDWLGNDLDGIFGLGPIDLTEDTVTNTYEVPTVMDNLYAQRTISSEVLGIYFVPASADDTTGELTFGGYDNSKLQGDINYVPITSISPASNYWGVDQSISYEGVTILSQTAGIVDTGTTLILIANDAFYKYQIATGAILDPNTGLLKISPDQYQKLSPLNFNIGGVSYQLTPNAQIWPRSLNTALGGTSGDIYLVVSYIGSNSGSGLDFINGYCFLERFYSVYDTTNSRVGFAVTGYTDAMTN